MRIKKWERWVAVELACVALAKKYPKITNHQALIKCIIKESDRIHREAMA